MIGFPVLALIVAVAVLAFRAGWHARTWRSPDDSRTRREFAAGLDAIDRTHRAIR